MKNYFYFGVIRFEEVDCAGVGRTKRVPVTHYGSAHSSFAKMMKANNEFLQEHPGERFTWTVSPYPFALDEKGRFLGYVDEKTGNIYKYLINGKLPE